MRVRAAGPDDDPNTLSPPVARPGGGVHVFLDDGLVLAVTASSGLSLRQADLVRFAADGAGAQSALKIGRVA